MAAAKHIADAPERITEYIESLPDFSKKICLKLREILLKSDPKLIEDWKWGPNYNLDGMVCGYAGFQKHVNFVFFKGALLKDKRKLLENTGSLNNRHFRFTHIKEIDEEILLEYIFEAIDNNRNGKKSKVAKEVVVEVPASVKKEFKLAGVWEAFESQSYSHRKEYIRWIEEAKKPETRVNRITKAILMLDKKGITKRK